MSSAVCKKYLDMAHVQIKLSIKTNAALAFLIVAFTPLVFGIKNLDSMASSFVLERFVALIGIILFTPLLSPESDRSIREVIKSKYTAFTLVYLLRLLLSAIVLFILIGGSVFFMRLNHCSFPAFEFIFGTLSSALFLGSLGFMAHALSNSIVIGYLLPVLFYMLNMFQGSKLKIFYLFSLSNDSMIEKYWLFGSAILLFIIGLSATSLFSSKM